MNSLQRVNLHDPRFKIRSSSKKIMIGLLGIMVVAVMIVWFGFLGWGVVEILRAAAIWTKTFWTITI